MPLRLIIAFLAVFCGTAFGSFQGLNDPVGQLTSTDENRLVRISDDTSAHSFRTEFAYDGFGRLRKRIELQWVVPQDPGHTNPPPPITPDATLSAAAGGGGEATVQSQPPPQGDWQVLSQTWYVYDGFRVIQERDGSNKPLVSYTRGLDLSGSLEGLPRERNLRICGHLERSLTKAGARAVWKRSLSRGEGGIGGLLARTHNYSPYSGNWAAHNYYYADAGGNVTRLVSASKVTMANYRYDPFGNLVSKSGALADANTYRFSSKELHVNSGLYYCGYRFYSPNWQRWMNPDPIGEAGGINLYGFVGNGPVMFVDPYGLWSFYKWLYTGDGNISDEVYQEAMDAAADAANASAQVIHNTLDAVGTVDPTGIADGVNGGIYAMQGDAGNAGLCIVSILPGGDLVKLGKGSKYVDELADLAKVSENAKTCNAAKTTPPRVFQVTPQGVALPPGPKYQIPSHYVQNPHRPGSYGVIENGRYVEKLRIDPATPPGMKGPEHSHYHLDGGKTHYSPRPGDPDPGFN